MKAPLFFCNEYKNVKQSDRGAFPVYMATPELVGLNTCCFDIRI